MVMNMKPYYHAYEGRYRSVFDAGITLWGNSPDDPVLVDALTAWVKENNLVGKTVADFACGEGGCGVILSRLGCKWHGFDVAPSAVAAARKRLAEFPDAVVTCLDMIHEDAASPETFDAALDCMGLHMLLTDEDRASYLSRAYRVLKPGAPMLFLREAYRENAYRGAVSSFDQWKEITGEDYDTPQLRFCKDGADSKSVMIPLVPARARCKEDYIAEMTASGFSVERLIEMDQSQAIAFSASIFVRK